MEGLLSPSYTQTYEMKYHHNTLTNVLYVFFKKKLYNNKIIYKKLVSLLKVNRNECKTNEIRQK